MNNTYHNTDGFFAKLCADSKRFPSRFTSPFLTPLHFLFLVFLTPGFQLALSIRIQEVFRKIPLMGKLLRRILWYLTTILFGSDIFTTCSIGSGIFFPHPYGIVIGDGCIIGKNVSINQNVTLGRKQHGNPGDPIISDGVTIYTGAVIIGPITIGENAVIGANSVVTKDVPAGATAMGIPARCIRPKTNQPFQPL